MENEQVPEVTELPAAVTLADINKLKEETKELKKEWEDLGENPVYQKDKQEEQKVETIVPQIIAKAESKKHYLLQTLGAAALFAAGSFAGIMVKSYETELRQCGSNTLTRITNAAYAIAGKTPECRPQEMQTKGLAEQLEYLSDTLPQDKFANLNADLEVVLEKYSRANNNTIKFDGGN